VKHAELQRALLAYYHSQKRDLPWRRTRDPYAIWVSEIMLQQTRVATVIPYYQRWLERFPDVSALADAPLDAVLEQWSGLGYYSRARNLHRGAREVVGHYGGSVPASVAELQRVPGIGRYTAGAIASIAFGARAPLVDGNVARVLARIFELELDVKSTAGQKALWALASELVPAEAPGDFNQALMELGATVCTPLSPACGTCPIGSICAARASGRQAELPILPPRKRASELPALILRAAWIERGGALLVMRRRPEGLYGGLWELPQAESRAELEAELPGVALGRRAMMVHEQILSHRRMRLSIYRGQAHDGLVAPASARYDNAMWQPLDQVDGLGISAATRAVVNQLRGPSQQPEPKTWTTAPKRSPSSRRATRRSSTASNGSATPPEKTRTSTTPRRGPRAGSPSSSPTATRPGRRSPKS
jgi:A/G-specific adenine glycosylase